MRIARGLVLLALGLSAPLQAEPRWSKERAWECLKSITARPVR